MAVRDILLLGNPLLRARCEPVGDVAGRPVQEAIEDLADTLSDFRARRGFGRGIAAPQIGITRRIIYTEIDRPLVLVNPQITRRSPQMTLLWDDCFSFPDLVVKVRRHSTISVRFADEKGVPQHLDAAGGLSELLQHEIDHIDGVLAIDRAIDTRHILLRSEWEKMALASRSTVQL